VLSVHVCKLFHDFEDHSDPPEPNRVNDYVCFLPVYMFRCGTWNAGSNIYCGGTVQCLGGAVGAVAE
jgi:hypothetical protein